MAVGPKKTLVLERYTETLDGMGGFSEDWRSLRSITGVFSIISDRERMMYGKKAEGASQKFMVDYPIGVTITAMDRFVSSNGQRIFEIVSREDPLEQHRMMIFFLTENVDG